MQMSQQVVYNAEICIEHPVPCHACNDDRNQPGNKDAGSENRAALEFLIQQNSCQHADDILTGYRAHCPDYGVFRIIPEVFIIENCLEVIQTCKSGNIGLYQVYLRKRIMDYLAQRIGNHYRQKQQSGRQHDPGCPVVSLDRVLSIFSSFPAYFSTFLQD